MNNNLNGKIMALDIGDKRIGIAFSALALPMALPYETYFRKSFGEDIEYIKNLILGQNVVEIVCGLPTHFDGRESEQGVKTQKFIDAISALNLAPVFTEDERFTTKLATDILIEGNVSRKDRKKVVDKIAASYILENFLNRKEK